MDDELEDRVLYQTYVSHMKLMSKFAVGIPTGLNAGVNTPLGYFWRLMRAYALKPEVLVCGAVLVVMLVYLQAVDVWSRTLLGRIQYTLGRSTSKFAANYARDKLIPNINKRVIELKAMIAGRPTNTKQDEEETNIKDTKKDEKTDGISVERKKSFRKTMSTSQTDECSKKIVGVTDPELLRKLDQLLPITREVRPSKPGEKPPPKVDTASYLDGDKINYARLLTDEVLAVDRLLVEAAKKNMDVAGTTALIALLEGNKLIVANVGDSRGVMCDGKGTAIPLSFDHKPQQQREKKRIREAGGHVTFNGVWRVAGILATSRALGDYPLKDKKLVIADPDILTFDLDDHNPMFLVLASDGLWDTFSNEEAISFIKERINEPHYGAKSITLQSYYRGSLDNITVVVINLKDRKYNISENKKSV
ncbi:probable protein phosphatase CG10417 isoform X2 [Cephus cinctus]|uniref:Probable protein phosphatase CG10417 isoform X2 n=1 Tax=Cephus cinctus TaxID=211228 RepID=A0AAJ7RT51_CEPCN|nr:probable protein phosphatase CG10417 isoform X2 [Cephus cinctus]